VVSAALIMIGGCANGDFGRVRPSLSNDGIHDWIGRDAAGVGGPVSDYPLTDDERLLRDLAYPLLEPPYDRNRWYSVLGEYGVRPTPGRNGLPDDRAAYWRHLDVDRRRSERSSYAQIMADARNDVVRIEPFFAAAWRVTDMDRKRLRSLDHVSHATTSEHRNAFARTRENAAIVGWVCRSLGDRTDTYRYALERLVLAMPSPTAVETERSLNLLQAQIGTHCRAAPAHGRRGRAVASDRPASPPSAERVSK
jgi:hypothetical protein